MEYASSPSTRESFTSIVELNYKNVNPNLIFDMICEEHGLDKAEMHKVPSLKFKLSKLQPS